MPDSADFIYGRLDAIESNRSAAAKFFELQALDIPPFQKALRSDSAGALIKACMSLADAIGSIDRGAFSWACVKLYYSAFYSAKALLFCDDECHIYLDQSPWFVRAGAKEKLQKGSGKSHDFAFRRLVERYGTGALFSQDIGLDAPFDWLRLQREEVQYRKSTFDDPEALPAFAAWIGGNPRMLLERYLGAEASDPEYLEIFDPDQAMIAFPVRLLAEAIDTHSQAGAFELDDDQSVLFRSLCRIGGHPVAVLNRLVES